MSNLTTLNIVCPGKNTLTEEIVSLITESSSGRIEFMANHAPIISSTIPTISVFTNKSGEKISIFTSTGIVQIKNNVINFCCDSFNFADEIDLARAEAAKERAEKRLQGKEDNIDIERAKMALARANARISIKK